MAAITTAQAGFWDVTTTWTGGVVPVSGDTVTLNHAVTMRDPRTVGASPGAGDPTNAIRVNATFTLAAGCVLTVQGDVGLNSAGLNFQAGAQFKFDASHAASPSTALYICGSINATAGNGFVTIAGTSGSRCLVSSDSGGANGRFKANDNSPFVADYCDFQRIGDASNPAILGWANTAQSFHLGNCTFDANCGAIGDAFGTGHTAGSIVELINVTHRSTGKTADIASSAPAGSNGRRIVSGCHFVGPSRFYSVTGYQFSDTTFEDIYDFTGGPWFKWDNMVAAIPQSAVGDWPTFGDVTNMYVLRVGAPTNPHGLAIDATTNRDQKFIGCIFDMPDGTDGAGDMITFQGASTPRTYTISKCIVLKSGTDVQVGTLVSCLGNANTFLVVEHNTYWSDGNSATAVYLGETFTGFAGMLIACHSNIAWNKTAGHACIVSGEPGVVLDSALAGTCHHNGVRNPQGNNGYSTNLSYSSKDGPGLHDVYGDPGFVDAERTIKSWDTANGGAGTVANAISEMRKKNDGSGYNSAYDKANLFAYIRAGFVPTNYAFRTGDVNGQDLGAVSSAPTYEPKALKFPKSVITRMLQGTL